MLLTPDQASGGTPLPIREPKFRLQSYPETNMDEDPNKEIKAELRERLLTTKLQHSKIFSDSQSLNLKEASSIRPSKNNDREDIRVTNEQLGGVSGEVRTNDAPLIVGAVNADKKRNSKKRYHQNSIQHGKYNRQRNASAKPLKGETIQNMSLWHRIDKLVLYPLKVIKSNIKQHRNTGALHEPVLGQTKEGYIAPWIYDHKENSHPSPNVIRNSSGLNEQALLTSYQSKQVAAEKRQADIVHPIRRYARTLTRHKSYSNINKAQELPDISSHEPCKQWKCRNNLDKKSQLKHVAFFLAPGNSERKNKKESIHDFPYSYDAKEFDFFTENPSFTAEKNESPEITQKDRELYILKTLEAIKPVDGFVTQEADLFWTTSSDMIRLYNRSLSSRMNVYSGQGDATHLSFFTHEDDASKHLPDYINYDITGIFSLELFKMEKNSKLAALWKKYSRCKKSLQQWHFEYNSSTTQITLVFREKTPYFLHEPFPVINVKKILTTFVDVNGLVEANYPESLDFNDSEDSSNGLIQLSSDYLIQECPLCSKFETVAGAVKIAQAFLKGDLYQRGTFQTKQKLHSIHFKYNFNVKQKIFSAWFNSEKLPVLNIDECLGLTNVFAANYIQSKKKIQMFFKRPISDTTGICELDLRHITASVPYNIQISPRIKFDPPLAITIMYKKP